jgi:hypothetical protein
MIFGKTYEQKCKEKQVYLESIKDGYVWFAWYPIIENHGQILWLEKVMVKPCVYKCRGGWSLSDSKPIYHKIK